MPEWTPTLREPDSLREFFLMELHMDSEKHFFEEGLAIWNDLRKYKLSYLKNLEKLFPYLFAPIVGDADRLYDACSDFAVRLRLKLGFNNYSRFEYLWRKELQKAFKGAAQAHFGKENFP